MTSDHPHEAAGIRRWLTGKKLIGFAIGGLILLRVLIAVIPIRLHISPETTVIDGPLRPDGTPDYAAYLNDQWSAGVTPENNAVVALIRAFGPETISEEIRQAYFDRLGIPVPEDAGHFVNLPEFLDAEGIAQRGDWDRIEEFEDEAARAREEPWTAEDYPEVAAWLEANEQAVSAIIDASQRLRYFSPLIPPEDGNLLSALMELEQQSRSGVRLLMSQAMLELGRGNVEQACELTLACHRLSRLLSEHPTLIGQLISYAIEAAAAGGDQAIVLSGLLTKDQSVAYREELATLPPLRSMADALDRGERLMSLDVTIAMYAGRASAEDLEAPPQLVKWGFDPNPVLRRFNRLYDEMVAAFALPDRTDRRRALEDLDRKYSTFNRPSVLQYVLALAVGMRSFISEQVGQVLCGLMFPATQQAANAEERTRIRVLLTDVGYALAAYKADHGAFPGSLDALVPDLLPAVPLDPITGDPLQYVRKDDGFLLYSVGNNGIDDGGLIHDDADDVAFGLTPEPPDE